MCRSRRCGRAASPISPTCRSPRPAPCRAPRSMSIRATSAISPSRSSACLNRKGEAVGPWAGLLSDEELLEGLRHMMTLRTFDARMQMAQRQGKTSFYMQHLGEEAVSSRLPQGARARRHEFPDLPAGRPADRRRLSDGHHDEPDLLQRGRSAEGPAAAGHVFLEGARLLLDLRQSGDAVHPGGRLGDGLGDLGRHAHRRRLDRRRLDRRIRLPRGAGLRLDLQGAGHPQRRQQPVGDLDLPGHCARRLRHLRGARPRLRHPVAAGRRQRLSRRPCRGEMGGRAGAPQSRADAGRIRHLPRRRAFDLGRSLRLSAEDRIRRLAARRSGRQAEGPSDRARRLVGRAPHAGRGRNPRHGDLGAEGGREPRHAACRRQAFGARHVRGRLRRDAAASRRQRQQAGV